MREKITSEEPSAPTNGRLVLEFIDASGDTLSGLLQIELRHQHLKDRRIVRDADASKRVILDGLHRAPQGIYKLRISSKGHQPCAQFVNIKPIGDTELDVVLKATHQDDQLEDRIGEIMTRHRQALNQELRQLDPRIVTEVAVSPGCDDLTAPPGSSDFFSDWHDNWNDGKRWAKTWGKAGDDILQLDPFEELRERYQISRLRELIADPVRFREINASLPKPLRRFVAKLLDERLPEEP